MSDILAPQLGGEFPCPDWLTVSYLIRRLELFIMIARKDPTQAIYFLPEVAGVIGGVVAGGLPIHFLFAALDRPSVSKTGNEHIGKPTRGAGRAIKLDRASLTTVIAKSKTQNAAARQTDETVDIKDKPLLLGSRMSWWSALAVGWILLWLSLSQSLLGLNTTAFYFNVAREIYPSDILVRVLGVAVPACFLVVWTSLAIFVPNRHPQLFGRSEQFRKPKLRRLWQKYVKTTALHLRENSRSRMRASRDLFIAVYHRLIEPPIAEGHVRVRYQCGCGANFFDDYPARLEAEAQALQSSIQSTSNESQQAASSASQLVRSRLLRTALSIKQAAAHLQASWTDKDRGLRTDHESQKERPGSGGDEDGPCYLTCFPRRNDRRAILDQVPEQQLKGDKCYFTHLRQHSSRLQGYWTSFFIPRKITSIRYVQFQLLHDNMHVDVVEDPKHRFPTDVLEYSPVKQLLLGQRSLYVGPNTLLHYYEKPHDCYTDLEILPRIPKRLKGQLKRGPEWSSGPVPGWGM